MRVLLASAAALLIVYGIGPVVAAAAEAGAGPTLQFRTADGGAPVTVRAKKKKKAKKESASISDIGEVRRGKKDLEIGATVAKSGRTCELKIKWKDGSTDEADSVESTSSKVCVMRIDVPSSRNAVGEATAELTVRDSSDNKVASAKKTFTVK